MRNQRKIPIQSGNCPKGPKKNQKKTKTKKQTQKKHQKQKKTKQKTGKTPLLGKKGIQ